VPLAVALCDVDNFKQINDRFGHNMGDQVLVHVAHALQTTLREVDLVGPLGRRRVPGAAAGHRCGRPRIVGERLRAGIEGLPVFSGGPSGSRSAWGSPASTPRQHDRLHRPRRSGPVQGQEERPQSLPAR
jgi:hypothetical protein